MQPSAVRWYVLSLVLLSTLTHALTVKELVAQAKGAAYRAAGQTVALQSFSPQGDVGVVNQARARFSEDMVRVGDPSVRNPFIVSSNCKDFGSGRWLDTRTWIYQFNDNLPALRCEFRLTPNLKSVQGKPLHAYPLYHFNRLFATVGYDTTAERGVRIVDSWPQHNNSVVEDQVFLLKLDKTTAVKSLPGNVWCLTSNLPERLPARFLTVAETTAFVQQQIPEVREWWRRETGHDWWDQSTKVVRRAAVKEWRAVSCGRRLTGGEGLRLVFSKNVATTAGVKRGSDQALSFDIRKPFTAAFSCSRQSPTAPCVPLADMQLRFSEVVLAEKLAAIRLQSGTTQWSPEMPEGQEYDGGDSTLVRFKGPFPANAAFTLTLPAGLVDPFNRPLANAARFPLTVRTDTWPPLAKFAADFGVVETAVGAVPLTVRNLESTLPGKTGVTLYTQKMADTEQAFIQALKRYSAGNDGLLDKPWIARQPGVTAQELPRQLSAKEFEVIGLPVTQGLYLHEVESRYLGEWIAQKPQPAYVHALSLVTNLGVHVQMGKVNGQVWVTDLAAGKPVANAAVSVWDCYDERLLWSGQTNEQGLVRVDRGVFTERPYQEVENKGNCQGSPWVIMAASGTDRSFALSEWNGGIESWRFNLYGENDYACDEGCGGYGYGETRTGDYVAHTIFDRTLLRAGETVHMRHLLRRNKLSGISAPESSMQVKAVIVEHRSSDTRFELSAAFSAIGNGSNEWTIPKSAKLGEYCVSLQLPDDNTLQGGCFKVSAFRLPVLKADLGLPAAPVLPAPNLPLQLQLQYLNGGGYSNAPVTLRGKYETDAYPVVSGFDEFSFYSVPVVPPKSQYESDWTSKDLPETALTLDDAGGLSALSPTLPEVDRVSRLRMEMEFRDPSGETQTVGASTQLWPAAMLPGLRVLSSWLGGDGPVVVEAIVVDRNGKPVANAPVEIQGALMYWDSHRKRTLGGYYAYDSTRREEAVKVPCANRTDAQGRLLCKLSLKRSGELKLKVIATDNDGRRAATESNVWVAGADDWWFDQGNDDRIDVIADKKQYAIGDTARLQVRMPFREATALVTVARDGVMDSFVTTLDGKDPVVNVQVKPDYAPNVYVSVMVVRGRNNAIQPTALVDLGKPAFKLGIAQLKVGWEGYKLGVKVQTDKAVYHPRDTVQATVQVSNAAGRERLPANTEVTLAVVDEALLELADNNSWDPLPSLVNARAYDLNTATNQLQVVGKRHFGKKALPSGGGGGRGGSSRELLDSLVYWKATATVDADGKATFSFPLNDSLSAFRVVAVASSRDQFGNGSATIRSTRELQVLSGLPTVVRQGDRYQAEFTVRNSSDQPEAVTLTVRSPALAKDFVTVVDLPGGQSTRVMVPVTVPKRIDTLAWEISAVSPHFSDRLKVSQQVLTAAPLQTLAGAFTQLSPGVPYTLPLTLPAGSVEEGKIDLDLQPTLTGTLEPVRQWFRDYIYLCLEQKTTKAAGLQNPALWTDIMGDLPTYLDQDGLAAFFPGGQGSPFLTVHVLRLAKALNWTIPAESRERMLTGLENYVQGKLPKATYEYWIYDNRQDLIQRQMQAMSLLAQYNRFKPVMLDNIRIQPAMWDTHILIDWRDLLRSVPGLANREARLNEVNRQLRAQLTQEGSSVLVINERRQDRWWWFDSNEQLQARLILSVLGDKAWEADLPLLVRGLLRHQKDGHWQDTQANLWGGMALTRFNEGVQPVNGQTRATLAGESRRHDWAVDPQPVIPGVSMNPVEPTLSLPWPKANSTLNVQHDGGGKPWLRVLARAPVLVTRPDFKGYTVTKTVEPVTQKVKGQWSMGDVARIKLRIIAAQDMGWVVVNDPVPAGAVLLGRGLKRDSALLSENDSSGWWPEFVEFAADGYRAYYEYLGKNADWEISYTVRLNQAGEFRLPPTRVESMYAPDVYGMLPNSNWTVAP